MVIWHIQPATLLQSNKRAAAMSYGALLWVWVKGSGLDETMDDSM